MRPVAFRAGGGLASLLHGLPLMDWDFALADSGLPLGGGPIHPNDPAVDDRPPIRDASDIVGISEDGFTWLLDPSTGRVTGEDMGGNRRVVTGFGVRGRVRTACALGERAVAYIDEARPGEILVRDLEPPRATRSLPFPPGLLPPGRAGAAGMEGWTALRFGGSRAGPCVLHAPHMRGVVAVSDTVARAVTPFVEPLAGVDDQYATRAWYTRAADRLRRRAPRAAVLDATSFPGGVAVLFGGRTTGAGRLVDFYSESGDYVETMRLPYRALRIAAGEHRLVVLRERGDKAFLSSHILPARLRAGAPTAEPEAVAPEFPPHGRMLPADSVATAATR